MNARKKSPQTNQQKYPDVHKHEEAKVYPNERCKEDHARSQKVIPAKLTTPFKEDATYTWSAQLFEPAVEGPHLTPLGILRHSLYDTFSK